VQGTFALTISGRGFDSRVSPGMRESFLGSECVSCGACVQGLPDRDPDREIRHRDRPARTLRGNHLRPLRRRLRLQGGDARRGVVRMVPYKDGKANRGHSCVKGRFAWGYTNHGQRILKPMIRQNISDPWQEVSWDEAFNFAAAKFKGIQAKHGRDAVGGITSSRCTNEEVFVVQKLIRAGFGNNKVDTCARVCHSPTGYGLSTTFGTSAGTQDFDSVEHTDVVMIIGASPTNAHPVFASRLKKRLCAGAKLIVVDPRRTDIVRSAHVEAQHHLPLLPGTNVAVLIAIAHVIVTEGLVDEAFVLERCDWSEFEDWASFAALPKNSPEATAIVTGVDPKELRAAARLFATGGNGAIYYGLGVTEHSQGSTTVITIANLAMATGNIGRRGVGVNCRAIATSPATPRARRSNRCGTSN
jgi:formate dehydrogenase major subunit